MMVPMAPPHTRKHSPAPNSDDTTVDSTAGENEVRTNEATGQASESEKDVEEESPNKPASIPCPSTKASSTSSGLEHTVVPYTIPPWSEPPEHLFSLEVLKEGTVIEQIDVSKKGAYMFGRVNMCDFVLEHPTISRFHAVLQFKRDATYIFDLCSTHGTFVNKNQVKGKVYIEIHVGDVLRFGHSSRLYIFQGPPELMPPEGDLDKIRKFRVKEDLFDREASLLRAKEEASLANGISWGMANDAIEKDPEDGTDEITWQTYKGQLTERQEKTRSKIIKRMEKVSNMKKEIDAIRVKDIAQGGLTPGQQMQIGRNEQRITQIMEELDNLEETLNDSIRESRGARDGRLVGRRIKATAEEEECTLSDDDEFYDRTEKKKHAKKSGEQSVETSDSLLDKIEVVSTELEEKRKKLAEEREKIASSKKVNSGEDDLDAYMSGLSSQLVIDRTVKTERKISDLQAKLDKFTYLLRIADPSGEAARKRNAAKAQAPKSNQCMPNNFPRKSHSHEPAKEISEKQPPMEIRGSISKLEKTSRNDEKVPAYTMVKPQWLGDTRKTEPEDAGNRMPAANLDDAASISDGFVDYKDRKEIFAPVNEEKNLEDAAPGLIIRKRKPAEKADEQGADKVAKVEGPSSAAEAETIAADSVALLLKHNRGFHASSDEIQNSQAETRSDKANSRRRGILGPAKPDFLDTGREYESWVPPKGQTGDGRTSLNDRLGY
ncbi:hypothetical protein KSP39_PZI006332 [Platanthera zijinensis]|uniref:FHA domain-containing protein n=1 Tax=Platanthera zijinensis TaxID=2320716 RepID=A0AAP0BTY9_9ASPA